MTETKIAENTYLKLDPNSKIKSVIRLDILEDMGKQHEHQIFLNSERNECYVTVILLVLSMSSI